MRKSGFSKTVDSLRSSPAVTIRGANLNRFEFEVITSRIEAGQVRIFSGSIVGWIMLALQFANGMKKVGFVGLGFPKNLVDSYVLMGQFAAAGYDI